MNPVPVVLSKNLSRSIRDGHPWIFRDAVEGSPRIENGALVELRSQEGKALAVGYWDARSAIAVRILRAGTLPDPRSEIDVRLRSALQRRLEKLDRARTNAFRWIHGEADRLPGIHADLYDDVAVVRFDGEGAPAFYEDLGARLAAAAQPLKLREVLDRQSGKRLYGRGAPARFEVKENGLLFETAPGVGGKGGLFLDQRENREIVEKLARGRRMLNLFGYTGAFALYAARGGATSTDTVDTAAPAIAAARRNFDRNGLSTAAAGFHVTDAFEFLEAAVQGGRKWDLVVSDPPSFAPNRASLENARRAYTRLHRLAVSVTAPGGYLCAASCSSHVDRKEFLATVEEGAAKAKRRFLMEELRGAGADHPRESWFPEGDYLKFAVGRVK